MLEELRISVFAQPFGVHGAVSAKRLRRRLDDSVDGHVHRLRATVPRQFTGNRH